MHPMTFELNFDHHTQAPPLPGALQAFQKGHLELGAHALSAHRAGQRAAAACHSASEELPALLGLDCTYRFGLISSGAEAVAQVLYAAASKRKKKPLIVAASAIDEAPVLLTIDRLGERKTIDLQPDGQICLESLKKVLAEGVHLLSVPWVYGLTGVVQPIGEIAKLCHEKGVPLHVDITHAIGKLFLQFVDLPITYLSLDVSRIGAPRGIAALFVHETSDFNPLILGREPFNAPQMLALNETVRTALSHFDTFNLEIAHLRDRFEELLCHHTLLFQKSPRLPNTSVIAFETVASDALLYALSEKGLFASMGGGVFPRLSHVLGCCNVQGVRKHSALSFAFGAHTTIEEIERGAEWIQKSWTTLNQAVALCLREG